MAPTGPQGLGWHGKGIVRSRGIEPDLQTHNLVVNGRQRAALIVARIKAGADPMGESRWRRSLPVAGGCVFREDKRGRVYSGKKLGTAQTIRSRCVGCLRAKLFYTVAHLQQAFIAPCCDDVVEELSVLQLFLPVCAFRLNFNTIHEILELALNTYDDGFISRVHAITHPHCRWMKLACLDDFATSGTVQHCLRYIRI